MPISTKPGGTAPPRLTVRRLWHALSAPAPDERPPGVPRLRYRMPPRWLASMGRDLVLGRPRSVRDDCALAIRLLPRPPLVDGLEHVPPAGSVIVIANHYQRRDLWIGWPGALLCHALWTTRPDLSCHFVSTDRSVVEGATVPGTRWLFEHVARVWDFVPVTPPEALDAAPGAARHALRRCLRLLQPPDSRCVCLIIFPEGMRGSTRGLGDAPPGNGRSLLALAATGVPLLPAAVWEEPGGALHARFGPLWQPRPPAGAARDLDRWAGAEAMARIAALLPPGLRGRYSGASNLNTGTTT
jgi:1-acyl-sn-glycerol-3-phosphate acyltransferase